MLWKKRNQNKSKQAADQGSTPCFISNDLESNIKYIKEKIGANSDLEFREIPLTIQNHNRAFLIFIKNFVDIDGINLKVILPLSQLAKKLDEDHILRILPLTHIEQTKDLSLSIEEIFKGNVLLLFEKSEVGYLLPLMNKQKRSIEEASNEKTIRGAKDGFVEDIDTNIFLIRHRLPTSTLQMEEFTVGTRTKTKIAVLHVHDIADTAIVDELKSRIQKINVDAIIDSGMLEQYIEDDPTSIFPQINNTQRPDKAVAALLEGRICVICDTAPSVLILPAVFANFLSASDDYYERTLVGSFNRLLSYIAVFVTITLPSLYIALTSFHPELIPFNLLIPLAQARKGLPFPPFIEVILLEFGVEFLREMGLRMPESVGRSLGVVGGIVLGDAAIKANLVSPGMVIIVGTTAIASFTITEYSMVLSLRLVRFLIIILASLFGAFGVAIGVLFVMAHLIRMNSFTVPYLSPFAPLRAADIKDTFFRTFLFKMKKRPKHMHVKDQDRQSS